jgi:hypothetical protein
MNPILDWQNVQLLVTSPDHTRTYPARRIEDGPSGAVRVQADMVRVDAGAMLSAEIGLIHPVAMPSGSTATAVSWNVTEPIEPGLWPWIIVNLKRPTLELEVHADQSLSESIYA